MTETEWLASTNSMQMIEFIHDKASDRKFRLFAVACCRQLPSPKDEQFNSTLETTERYADGETTKASLKRARQGVRQARYALPNEPEVYDEWCAFWLAEAAATENAYIGFAVEMHRLANNPQTRDEAFVFEIPTSICGLLRDIFGIHFHTAAVDLAVLRWNDSTPSKLAHAIYADRAFDRLPILADALEEAGCTDGDILDHCRQPGEHVRGCWVVDLLLGKE